MLFSRQLTTPISTLFSVLVLTLGLAFSALADKTVAVDENWKVLLKDDGTWEFITQERFATGTDGKRFKLNADGTWQDAGMASTQLRQKLRNNNSTYALKQVVMEYAKSASSSMRKNARTEMQTIFTISAQLPSEAKTDELAVNVNNDSISVIDNRGKVYDVIAITPSQFTVNKTQAVDISIRIRESLRWGAKAMNLTIDKAVFDTESDLVYIATPYDMVDKKVSGF